MQYVLLGARFLIGVVFLVSAVSKLRSGTALAEFVVSLRQLGLLRPGWLRPVALVVALGEAMVPVLIALPVGMAASAGFLLAGGLLVAFSVAILIALHRGVQTACRSFGASGAVLGARHVVRNGVLLVVVAAGLAGVTLGSTSIHPGGVAVTALAGLVAGVLVVALDDLVELFVGSPAQSPAPHQPR